MLLLSKEEEGILYIRNSAFYNIIHLCFLYHSAPFKINHLKRHTYVFGIYTNAAVIHYNFYIFYNAACNSVMLYNVALYRMKIEHNSCSIYIL